MVYFYEKFIKKKTTINPIKCSVYQLFLYRNFKKNSLINFYNKRQKKVSGNVRKLKKTIN